MWFQWDTVFSGIRCSVGHGDSISRSTGTQCASALYSVTLVGRAESDEGHVDVYVVSVGYGVQCDTVNKE